MAVPDPSEPPKKRQKFDRKRKFDKYEEFVEIIIKLGKDYDPRLFACLEYRKTKNNTICTSCNEDKALKGPFTEHKPAENFDYCSLKKHIWSKKHTKRMSDDLRLIHPLTFKKALEEQKKMDRSKVLVMSDFEKILNAIKLSHLNIKLGLPDTKQSAFSKFIDVNCMNTTEHSLSSSWNVNEILCAMNEYQIECDDVDLLGPKKKQRMTMALDGSTQRHRDMKIFFGKGWKTAKGPVTKYVQGLNPQKNVLEEDVSLADLLSIDTGADNVKIIEKVVKERLGIKWNQLCQLAVDVASNDIGNVKGCATMVG